MSGLSGSLYFRRTLSRVDVQSKHSLSDIGKRSEAMKKFTEVVTVSYCTNLGFDLLANQEITMKIKSQMTTMRKESQEIYVR